MQPRRRHGSKYMVAGNSASLFQVGRSHKYFLNHFCENYTEIQMLLEGTCGDTSAICSADIDC